MNHFVGKKKWLEIRRHVDLELGKWKRRKGREGLGGVGSRQVDSHTGVRSKCGGPGARDTHQGTSLLEEAVDNPVNKIAWPAAACQPLSLATQATAGFMAHGSGGRVAEVGPHVGDTALPATTTDLAAATAGRPPCQQQGPPQSPRWLRSLRRPTDR